MTGHAIGSGRAVMTPESDLRLSLAGTDAALEMGAAYMGESAGAGGFTPENARAFLTARGWSVRRYHCHCLPRLHGAGRSRAGKLNGRLSAPIAARLAAPTVRTVAESTTGPLGPESEHQ